LSCYLVSPAQLGTRQSWRAVLVETEQKLIDGFGSSIEAEHGGNAKFEELQAAGQELQAADELAPAEEELATAAEELAPAGEELATLALNEKGLTLV